MDKRGKPGIPDDKEALLAVIDSLNKQIYRKQMELDVLNKAAEIVKKGQGIDPWKLANKEKVSLIDALRTTYPLNDLLQLINMHKSSYYYQKGTQVRLDKYSSLRETVKRIFAENLCCYGYRRVHALIKNMGIIVSEKVIRKIMAEAPCCSLHKET